MNEYQQLIEQKQKRRYKLLFELFKATKGKEHENVDFMEVANKAGFDETEASEIYEYFTSEGLFEDRMVVWGVTLSHKAIVEVENSITNPMKSTEHFSSTVIQNFHAPVGSVLTGNYNTANVNQNIGQDFSEILEQLAILKREFQSQNFEEKDDAIEIVKDLENEIAKEKPNKTKIKTFLITTKDFAVKTGTELAASTLAKLLESQMGIKG